MASGGLEIETKYDVDDTAVLPAVDGLPGVAQADEPLTLRLEATYFDTADLTLAGRGITLRRRTGGVDDGWHLKLPVGGDRQEIHEPLGGSADVVPVGVRGIVHEAVRDRELVPVATLSTERRVVALRDAWGAVVAELCDDRVSGLRRGLDGDVALRWREWELEEHGASAELVATVDAALRAAGARTAAYGSKAGRVLELHLSHQPARRAPSKRASEHDLLRAHLCEAAADLHRLDPLVRADVPDAVHQMRVLTRRLRSTLKTFERCFDVTATEPVRADLAWLGQFLGAPRDLEVLRVRLDAVVSAMPPALVDGATGPWIDQRLRAEREAARRSALSAMGTSRYLALVDTLDAWCAAAPWRDDRDRPAVQRLPEAADRASARLAGAVEVAAGASEGDRTAALHEVRKAAKRTRYAAEALEPVLRASARRQARAAQQVQTLLGDHHDAVVAARQVRRLADEPEVEAGVAFGLGLVHGRLESEASDLERKFFRSWKKLRARL